MNVEIVEIKKDWTVYGVGIIQQSNVVRAMAQLGLVDDYLGASYPFENVSILAPNGHLLATLSGRRLAGEQYPANLGISRPALHEVLTNAACRRGANVRLGITVNTIEQDGAGVTVTLSDGSRESYDLLVGADGVHSKIRSLLFPDAPTPRFTGQGVWRYTLPRPAEVDHLLSFVGPGGAGLVPLSQELMYLFVVTSEPGNPRMPSEQMHTLMQQRASIYGGLVGELKHKIVDPQKVVYKPLEVVMLPEPWFKGRAILIGDAAHATTPHLGQGAGMAIEDAIVLRQELRSGKSIEDSLKAFMLRRFQRCKYIVEKSELVGFWQMNQLPEANVPPLVNEMMERTAEPI